MRRGLAVAREHNVEPRALGTLCRAHGGEQRLAYRAVRRHEQHELAAPAAHSADLHTAPVQAGERHLRRRLPELQGLLERERAGRCDALMKDADLPRERDAYQGENQDRHPERNLRGDHETHSTTPLRIGRWAMTWSSAA